MPLSSASDHMEPGHLYAGFQRVFNDFGTLQGFGDLRQFMVDAGYLWRAPTDEEWEAMVEHFHKHYEQRAKPFGKKGGER